MPVAGSGSTILFNHTGDNELVTAKVCRSVGLDAGHVVQGGELDALSDQELALLVEQVVLVLEGAS